MPKPYDAALNALIDARPDDWAGFLAARAGVPPGPATPLDTDLSATLQADRLFRVDGPAPAVLHLELEATGRLGVPRELVRYNAFAHHLTGLPVHSVLVVLRPKANASDQTGVLSVAGADGAEYLRFRYAVVRVWREPAAGLLAAGPGVAPLALLTDEAAADLPAAVGRVRDRLRAAAVSGTVERNLLGSAFVLCGLRYDAGRGEEADRTMSLNLEDSTTYQLLVARGMAVGEARGEARGEVREAQALILRLGAKRFGPAPDAVQAAVRGIAGREDLERVAERVLDAAGWDDLLRAP